MILNEIPRYRFAQLPTPVEELPRMSAELAGPTLLVKRDDQTGLALGGNKVRKLEFLVKEAVQQGADTLITAGGVQSNHCRQTAAAAAKLGLDCDLCLGGDAPDLANGNLLLNQFCGARVHFTAPSKRNEEMERIANDLRESGRTPYIIPIGGSNGLGALGYVQAMFELKEQMASGGQRVDRIVVASSSGGTQAGLGLGAKLTGFEGTVLGISIDQLASQTPTYEETLSQIANDAAEIVGADVRLQPKDFAVNYSYLGGGYGVIGSLERDAIWQAARLDALILDPVYTGRAAGALVDLIHHGQFSRDETVLFWHTGGAPALFARTAELV